ncbi:chemotaxis protein MotC [Mesorhizobium sp. SP-1A]|uniref:chemotaxis protein MotC n=1 Tax=Mesorhizobium sp. SP-1A TaxID=3077840 RepID=UPI0028F72B19|nr:chemotaxis protein MotC [Mesorhizobium sp. SP-1A]
MSRRARTIGIAALVATFAATLSPARAGETLQPYQMVRSLQLVQDRIAAGDHAALPMQAKLLEMADARFRSAGQDEMGQPRNLHALLVYGMSGGNPTTVAAATARLGLEGGDRAVADGVIAYLNGDPAGAMNALKDVQPMALPSEIGAFVALVKGSLLAAEEPQKALALFDQARLLSPGTLVEEAALRRSIRIAATTGEAARFALASTQYVERFLHSPYASQFADSFVSGAVALNQSVGEAKLAEITSMMDPEREQVIYLRIARRAAIDGLAGLSAFASAKAAKGQGPAGVDSDPRAQLYASLSALTTDNVDEIQARLKNIDRDRLSANDRSLLEAAQTITKEVIAPPPPLPADTATAPGKTSPASAQAAPALAEAANAAAAAGLPPVEGAVSERPAVRAAGTPATPVPAPAPPTPPAAGKAGDVAVGSDATDNAIADARRKLDSIDQMLGASPQ